MFIATRRAGRRPLGFTLIETMIAVTLLVIVMGFAIGPFQSLIARMRITAAVNDFVAGLGATRAAAITGRSRATLCAGTSDACGTDWTQGARLFLDTNGDGALDDGEVVKRRLDAVPNLIISADSGSVTFDRDGTAVLEDDATSIRLLFCDPQNRAGPRRIMVLPAGGSSLYQPTSCSLD